MALVDDVALRYPSQLLLELTNGRDATASSVDATVLAQAASSIEAYFQTYAEETYDGTVAIHLEIACKGVVGLLRQWSAGTYEGSREFWNDLKEECDRIKGTRSRARIVPSSNSQLAPTDENPTGERLRPWSDDTVFRGLVPRRVSGLGDTERDY